MSSSHESSQTRQAAVSGLAVVGFIALILIGIATAIYAASFIPKAFSRLSSANVYLSDLVDRTKNDAGSLVVVNNATTTTTTTEEAPTSIPLTPAEDTKPQTTQVTTTTPKPTTTTTHTTTPTPTYTATTQTQVRVPVSYYGRPDLVTTITSVGYLRRSGDTSSFVAAQTVPAGYQGAVRFVIANRGTNVASRNWNFRAELPTSGSNSNYESPTQRELKPGDSLVFTLGFDSTERGTESIRITADQDRDIDESNESNNTATATIKLNGSSSSSNNTSDREYDSNGTYCRYGTYYQNGRYYCESNSRNNSDDYDSRGNYCSDGTYYSNGRYYCN